MLNEITTAPNTQTRVTLKNKTSVPPKEDLKPKSWSSLATAALYGDEIKIENNPLKEEGDVILDSSIYLVKTNTSENAGAVVDISNHGIMTVGQLFINHILNANRGHRLGVKKASISYADQYILEKGMKFHPLQNYVGKSPFEYVDVIEDATHQYNLRIHDNLFLDSLLLDCLSKIDHGDFEDLIQNDMRLNKLKSIKEMPIQHSDKIYERLCFLERETEADPNVKRISNYSLDGYIRYLSSTDDKGINFPVITITPFGYVRIQWRRNTEKYFSIEFISECEVKTIVLSTVGDNGAKKTTSSKCPIEEIFEPNDVLSWITE